MQVGYDGTEFKVVSTDNLEGYKILEYFGIVYQSYGYEPGALLNGLPIQKLIDNAKLVGANAIIGFHMSSDDKKIGRLYGTAVKVKKANKLFR